MSRLRAWTWKEAREHRWALFGVWLAVALITAAPFVVLREETTRTGLDQLPGLAIALATLVLGLDLFARETRRSTHALILRTPGAMRWAFPAKLLLFAVGTLGALAIEELLRHPLEAVTGIPRAYRYEFYQGEWRRFDRPIQSGTQFGLPTTIYLGCLAMAVGLWHVAGSVASPRAGVGALCGALALGVLSVPLMLLNAQHPWWFRPSASETYAWIAGIGGAGLLVAGVAWYSGRRFLFPRKAAALRGGVIALVLGLLVTGAAAYAIDRWEAADPRAPEFRIESGFLGEGGKRLYLTTSRGGLYGEQTQEGRQSPPSAWTVSLDDPMGHASSVRMGAWFRQPERIARNESLVPLPFVVRIDQDLPRAGDHTDLWTWVDTRTDRAVQIGGERTLTAVTVAASRATAKAQTPLRDSQGRRVWWVEDVVERDGDEDRIAVERLAGSPRNGHADFLPNGFLVEGSFRDPDRPEYLSYQRLTIDAETGEMRKRFPFGPPNPPGFDRGAGTSIPLSDTKFLQRQQHFRSDGTVAKDSGWLIWDATVADQWTPAAGAPTGRVVESGVPGTLLVPHDSGPKQAPGEVASTRLVLWKPLTGEHLPVLCADATLLSPGLVYPAGVLPDGRRLLGLYELVPPSLGRHALVLFDIRTRTITPVAPWSAAGWKPIAFDVDGSLLVIEGSRRVVRLSDQGRKREVVWPK